MVIVLQDHRKIKGDIFPMEKHRYCPLPHNHLASIVMVLVALGFTLWGVIAIISGLVSGYYAEIGIYSVIGNSIVLATALGGVVFFTYILVFFLQCQRRESI